MILFNSQIYRITKIKVNGYTPRGSNSAIFCFASLNEVDSSVKNFFLPLGASSLLFKLTPVTDMLCHPRKQRESFISCSPLLKRQKNMLVYPYTLIQAVGIFFVMLLKYIFQTMEIVQRPVISPYSTPTIVCTNL